MPAHDSEHGLSSLPVATVPSYTTATQYSALTPFYEPAIPMGVIPPHSPIYAPHSQEPPAAATPPVEETPNFTDDFNRSDGGLGDNWTTGSGFGALSVASNACKGVGASVHNVEFYTASEMLPADQYAQFRVTTPSGFMGPVLRSDGVNNHYVCFYQSGNASIYKAISGNFTEVASGSLITPIAGDIVYLEAVGNTLTMKVNSVVVCTGMDSSITGAGYAGISLFDTTAAVDDFECGEVSA